MGVECCGEHRVKIDAINDEQPLENNSKPVPRPLKIVKRRLNSTPMKNRVCKKDNPQEHAVDEQGAPNKKLIVLAITPEQ